MSIRMYHIPVCPFSQRLEILLELKGMTGLVEFVKVDITKPRDPHILALTGGTTMLPVFELEDGRALKESLVLMDYLETRFPEPAVRRADPYERAIENLLVAGEGAFVNAGYRLPLNQDPTRREVLAEQYLAEYRKLNEFLVRHGSKDGPWLFDRFGWAETVYTPFFRRFVFVGYYDGVEVPNTDEYARVLQWREACLAHPAAQQVCDEEIIKLYYDYSRGAGNGGVLPGRTVSSFVFEPHWRDRPWPPRGKDGPPATDRELGLV